LGLEGAECRCAAKKNLWWSTIPTPVAEIIAVLRIQDVQFKTWTRNVGHQLGEFA
jgi:hypothetical protein